MAISANHGVKRVFFIGLKMGLAEGLGVKDSGLLFYRRSVSLFP